MVQIPVGSSKFGEVTLLEGGTVQLPETAKFLPHGTAGRRPLAQPPVSYCKVYEFLETSEGTLGAVFFPGVKGLQDTGSFAADVGHLLRERQFGPSAVFQGSVLHLCCNEFVDNGFDGFPNLRVLNATGWIPLPGANIDEGVELYEIFAFFLYQEIEAPKIRLCRAILQQKTFQVCMEVGINGQKASLDIGHAFNHVAEGIMRQFFKLRYGDCLLKDLHNQVF